MKTGINKTVLSPEIGATVDQISDAFSKLPWEFKKQQEYNWISHFQLTCWEVKKKKKQRINGKSTKIRHGNFPNHIYCMYCWNLMKAVCRRVWGQWNRKRIWNSVCSARRWALRSPPSSIPCRQESQERLRPLFLLHQLLPRRSQRVPAASGNGDLSITLGSC